jgi:hypothetical protein
MQRMCGMTRQARYRCTLCGRVDAGDIRSAAIAASNHQVDDHRIRLEDWRTHVTVEMVLTRYC